MKFPYVVGQKFSNEMGDLLEITDITRYRVYYRITLPTGGVDYSARFTFATFPATYIDGMLGKTEFREAVTANVFIRQETPQ